VQGDVTKHSLRVVIPVVSVIVTVGRLGSQINIPLALCPKVGLHTGVPLLPVGASEHRDHLVESAGHGESCWESMKSASECNNRQARKEENT